MCIDMCALDMSIGHVYWTFGACIGRAHWDAQKGVCKGLCVCMCIDLCMDTYIEHLHTNGCTSRDTDRRADSCTDCRTDVCTEHCTDGCTERCTDGSLNRTDCRTDVCADGHIRRGTLTFCTDSHCCIHCIYAALSVARPDATDRYL